MTSSVDNEKRQHSRVDFKTEIRIIVNAPDKTAEFKASSKDLSLKGIFVHTTDLFDQGTPCEVNIHLTGSIEAIVLRIQGSIVRKSEKGMAVEFKAMDVDAYTHLKNIISYNTSDEDSSDKDQA
ncbi:MAG: PilZ domain-containing protein [Desulfobacteraceae bacterium]|nr:MAG: PilZ domain-containing protein [Desulfobacteraceae bacterium]